MKRLILALFTLLSLFEMPVKGENIIINFIPQPQKCVYTEGEFQMDKHLVVVNTNLDSYNLEYLKKHFERVFDFKLQFSSQPILSNYIRFETDNQLGDEAYNLVVEEKGITITSNSKAGQFYALQTLFQMMPAGIYKDVTGPYTMLLKEWSVPCVEITDYPRFAYRGNMLDISRTYFDKDYLMRHLDYLAYHKINKFHIHIADDNGWRIEIKKYPLLTEKGAWRGYGEVLPAAYNSGNERYGGFLTQAEMKEVVKHAQELNIEIIPEIDLPGHSKSFAASYPEILCNTDKEFLSVQAEGKNVFCVGKENNYKILENVIKELVKIFPGEYIHIGGDEVAMKVWNECPDCQALMKREGMKEEKELLGYFVRRMEKILEKYGKKLAGWDEIVEQGELKPTSRVYAWRRMWSGLAAVKQGRPTIMQIGEYCYIDMKQSAIERGHNWAGIVTLEKMYSFDPVGSFELNKEEEKLIVGPQAGLWTEMLVFPPHFSEYQLFPRLCALAEIGWTAQELRNFDCFNNRLVLSHYERLYNMGIAFRLPYPEVQYKNNVVKVTSPAPSLVVRYTMDGSEPTINSHVLTNDIITADPTLLKFATFFATNKSITVGVPGYPKYLTPEVVVTTSMESTKNTSVAGLQDYDFATYFRSANPPKEGDWFLYNFKEAVDCKKITVTANIPVIDFWGVTDGHVEYSYDGVNFVPAGRFNIRNQVIIQNKENKAIKAVRVIIDGPCEEKAVAIQDLKIE